MNLLTRLPISTYWTTNYDKVIENGLKKIIGEEILRKKYKILSVSISDSDAIVYKNAW